MSRYRRDSFRLVTPTRPSFPLKKPLRIEEPDASARDSIAEDPPELATDPEGLSPKEYARAIASRLFFIDLLAAFSLSLIAANGGLSLPPPMLVALCAAGALVYVAALSALKTYEIRNLSRVHLALGNIIKAAAAWTVVVFALSRFVGHDIRFVFTLSILVVGMAFWRMFAMVFGILRPAVRRRLRSRVVIVGWTDMVGQLVENTRGDFTADFDIVGCVPLPHGAFSIAPPPSVPVLCRYMGLLELIKGRRIDTVVLADHLTADEFQGLATVCQRQYVDFHVIPAGFPTLRSCLDIHVVGGVPLIGYGSLPLDKVTNRILKRLLDIAGASFGLLCASPIIALFCLFVYVESPGPVFYRQRRSTRGGRDFSIIKIRSMKVDAEAKTGAVWCKKVDDRRLKVGSFMRKTNIDELPQFWNVLKGDMSLVGPRPERPELISQFKHSIDNYNARHMVKAGLTGWAAINGWRGDTDLNRRIEADIYYLENWSLSLDLYCIFATLFKIKNAY
ncbi:MAG: exopolysaccharide biosynthesis polyprenyl glycosylphosphotransferase [Opitutaceae bacterium]|nr:exopolysaccharide biosynthesis polyprenyl glycosylphosphotransferase [Opitutaceae bacterium]